MDNFDEIYKRYYRQVFFYILDLCGNKDIAEEITQEAFFKVLKKIDTFRGECSIHTWIIEIAKNTYLNYCKKKKHESPSESLEMLSDEKSPEEALSNKEMALEIHQALHKLPQPYREVFWMRTFGELSFKEIGRILGKTESWARVTYHRARLMIKEGVCE